MPGAPRSNQATEIESAAAAQPVASDDEKAQAAAEAAAADEANPNKGLFVLYTGPQRAAANAEALKKRQPQLGEGTTAEITPTDWRQVGIEAKRNYVWNLGNNWRIPASQFTQEQLDYLLTNSKRFELVDGEGAKVDR